MTKSKITYDSQLMKTILLFENMTGTSTKDCFVANETVYFVIDPENMGRAIGKAGSNVKRLEFLLKKKIRILEFNPDLATFINNLIYPLTIKQVEIKDGKVVMTGTDTKNKAMLIGRNASNLNNYKSIIQRYFDIAELKVI